MNDIVLYAIGAFFVLVLVYVVFVISRFRRLVAVSGTLVAKAVGYSNESTDTSVSMLVLGDSTAVGVGSDVPEESVPGRVSKAIGATYVENIAKSGAVVADLAAQVHRAKRSHYNLILIQIGGNDIVRLRNANAVAAELGRVVRGLPKADRVIVFTAGDVGGATIFPFFLSPLFTKYTAEYSQAFQREVTTAGATFINLHELPSTPAINGNPKKYLAADGFHPSSAGYELWFNDLRPFL